MAGDEISDEFIYAAGNWLASRWETNLSDRERPCVSRRDLFGWKAERLCRELTHIRDTMPEGHRSRMQIGKAEMSGGKLFSVIVRPGVVFGYVDHEQRPSFIFPRDVAEHYRRRWTEKDAEVAGRRGWGA